MDINSIYSSTGSPLVESVYGEQTRTAAAQEKNAGVPSWGEDVISISTAAREKVAAMSATDGQDEDVRGQGEFGSGSDSGAGPAAGNTAGGGSESGDSDGKVARLKAKLQSLQSSLFTAPSSEAAAIAGQIGQVMAEIAALESEIG